MGFILAAFLKAWRWLFGDPNASWESSEYGDEFGRDERDYF